ncbi:MAG: ATP-binding cassette domain-containing protein, partial [Candidatus Binatia bacterium]
MIQIVELRKHFAGHEVLKGVNLKIETAKITTIIGGSGCGKTVLLKHLNALLVPDHGQVNVDGVDISRLGQKELNNIRHRFGVLFQGAALLDSMT